MSLLAGHMLLKSLKTPRLASLRRRYHEMCPPEVCPGVPGKSKCCMKRSPPRPCLLPLKSCCPVPAHLCPRPLRPPQPECCPIVIPAPSCGYCPGPCPRSKDIPY